MHEVNIKECFDRSSIKAPKYIFFYAYLECIIRSALSNGKVTKHSLKNNKENEWDVQFMKYEVDKSYDSRLFRNLRRQQTQWGGSGIYEWKLNIWLLHGLLSKCFCWHGKIFGTGILLGSVKCKIPWRIYDFYWGVALASFVCVRSLLSLGSRFHFHPLFTWWFIQLSYLMNCV